MAYEGHMGKQPCLMIDLDGTLADISNRRKFLSDNKDWEKFFQNIHQDDLNRWCFEIINRFKNDHKIILVTGRMEKYSAETEKWLRVHNVHYDILHFRKDEDFRPDQAVKEEIYIEKISPAYSVLFVIDDRSKVVEKWRELGLVCLQCDKGDF